MKEKVVSIDKAMEMVHDGQTIMVPGFVNCGVPPVSYTHLKRVF